MKYKLKNQHPFLTIFVLLILFEIPLEGQVILKEEMWNLPTYEVAPAEKAPMFYTGESFQGARKEIYPYALNDIISQKKTEKGWKAITLENEYIKLCITPDIGGKLYYATDKTNDYNFIYKNNEVKPVNIGMTGAWVSGGIEWCVFHHHRASTMLPMDYSISENEDGSKTIFIGETEPRHRMRWTVAVTVYPGKSYFEAELSVYNPTPYTNTFLYWANVATHTNENYQVIFPPSVNVATFHSKNVFTHWPISTEVYRGQDFTKGVDISWWKNVRKSASFFAHDLKEDFMGGYDHRINSGTVHIGDHNIVKGAKLWEWGSGARGQATEGRLTETSGPYVEVMVGAYSDNQPDYTWIRPYEVKKWKQYWYPVKDIKGFKNANLNAAVNLEQRDDNKIFLGYYSTQILEEATIVLKNNETIVFQKELKISPDKTFSELISIEDGFEFTNLSTELINAKTGEVVISYQPKKSKKAEELPPVVEPPLPPEEIETVEELFLTGSRLEQFYKDPDKYYKEALKRDPGNIRVNTAIGNQHLRNGNYTEARKYFAKAIKRLTRDYTRPSNCEALYQQGITLKALELYEEAIDTLYRATWDYAWHSAAFFELAQISCILSDYKKAQHQIEESLSTNSRNHRAVCLKAAILRNLGEYDTVRKLIATIQDADPLNFRLENELYLIEKQSGNAQKAESHLNSLTEKMRKFDQNYLELAVGYINDGMFNDAKDVLIRYQGENPIVHYYLGFLEDKLAHPSKAKEYFEKANKLPVDYYFPYRLETIKVLKKALSYNKNDGKAYYYLGNILYNKQPSKAIEFWELAVQSESGLAMAHRNLGWGYYWHYKNISKAIPYYEKAIALDNSHAILYTELDQLYELSNSPVSARLKLFEGNEAVVNKRDDAFVRMITVFTLADKPDQSVAHLNDKVFSYREGNSRVREVIIDAHLSLGIKYFKNKDYQNALKHFLLAQIPEEEAGSARSGNREIQVNYYIAQAYEALKKDDVALNYYNKATSHKTKKTAGIMDYYKGLSYLKLDEKSEAKAIFNQMIKDGNQILADEETERDFFAIFGKKEDEKTIKSRAYTLRGFGYAGLNKNEKAKTDIKKAVELSVSNLWAIQELSRISSK